MEYFILNCLEYLMRSVRPALLLYVGIVCIRWARGREISIDGSMIWEYLWVWWLVAVLRVTGITGMRVDWPWSIFHSVRFGFSLSGDGLARTLLSGLMFVPCGFLTPRALKGIRWDMPWVLALGAFISITLEMLQAFSGQSVELASMFMGAAGAAVGYLLYNLLCAAKGRLSPLRKDANLR